MPPDFEVSGFCGFCDKDLPLNCYPEGDGRKTTGLYCYCSECRSRVPNENIHWFNVGGTIYPQTHPLDKPSTARGNNDEP